MQVEKLRHFDPAGFWNTYFSCLVSTGPPPLLFFSLMSGYDWGTQGSGPRRKCDWVTGGKAQTFCEGWGRPTLLDQEDGICHILVLTNLDEKSKSISFFKDSVSSAWTTVEVCKSRPPSPEAFVRWIFGKTRETVIIHRMFSFKKAKKNYRSVSLWKL